MEKYLPIGTIVTLKENPKKVMIMGRMQKQVDNDQEWDYSACLYPEGYIGADQCILFQHESIDQIFSLGYRDAEEFKFLSDYLDNKGINL